MILFEGKLMADEELDYVLERLWDSCLEAVDNRRDFTGDILDACQRISDRLKSGFYDAVLNMLMERGVFTKAQLDEVLTLFDRENLELKYNVELGNYRKEVERDSANRRHKIVEPLGVLFHIAAGNAEGLPFYSVLEGLLAGNVNILKLPSMDDGISIMLLHEIIKEAPVLAPYICVLDVPSTNLSVMKKLAEMADAVVVWGSDEAIAAIRAYAKPQTRIISWGHKLSFAYTTADVLEDKNLEKELYELAHHICRTKQVLCSSCQGLFVDSGDMDTVKAVGRKFFDILREVSEEYPPEAIGIRGKMSITLYNEELENRSGDKLILKGDGVSVIVSGDSKLELSNMFRNCWVKPLPFSRIVCALKENKGHLQTVGLICHQADRKQILQEFCKAGVTRITYAGTMSDTLPGEAHDGEYPLRSYSRIVEWEE